MCGISTRYCDVNFPRGSKGTTDITSDTNMDRVKLPEDNDRTHYKARKSMETAQCVCHIKYIEERDDTRDIVVVPI